MKVLLVHNYYKQRGGEDVVFEAEARLLQQAGFDISLYSVRNDVINRPTSTVRSALTLYGISEHRKKLVDMVRDGPPDVVHFHNVFPLISTDAFRSVRMQGCAVVHTIHNFRPICAAGTFFREGRVCELCLSGASYHAVRHKCYRSSRLGSAILAGSIARDKGRNVWSRDLDAIITLTQFTRNKLIEGGLPAEKVVVKGNSTADPGPVDANQERHGLLYVGRLSPEKGVHVLLEAAKSIGQQITICGDGPEGDRLRAKASRNVHFIGSQPYPVVQQLMRAAKALVMPSLWYEGFPMTVVEALANGTPIVASNIGSLTEIVQRSKAGYVFQPGDVLQLVATLHVALADPLGEKSLLARRAYEDNFSEPQNIARLTQIYTAALQRRRGSTLAGDA